jgi:phosphoesterase RecJ-like protein
VINVDHHSGNTEFGDLNLVVTTASSTAELVTHLLIDCDVEIDRDIATCLYTGVVTDTGRFQYSNTTPDVLRLAADLLAFDVPAAAIALEVFESSPFGYLKLLGRVLERAVLDESQSFVYSWLTLEDLAVTKVAPDETEKVIDVIRSTRSAEVAALIKEQPDGTFRVSLRSKGPTSVGEIARANGGGGHELAAGFTAASVDGATSAILSALARRAER